jgi:hypothetical protein
MALVWPVVKAFDTWPSKFCRCQMAGGLERLMHVTSDKTMKMNEKSTKWRLYSTLRV